MKKNLMKKVIAAAVVAALTSAIAMPAMATEAVPEGLNIEIVAENDESLETETVDDVTVESGALGTKTEEAPQLDAVAYGTGIYKVNGQYLYYVNGVRRYTTNVIKIKGVWYNLVNGVVTGNTIAKNSSGWWYINSAGRVNFSFTGIARNSSGWWYCKGGKVQFNVNDVLNTTCNGTNAWYNIRGGKLTGNTVAKNRYGWWYIDKCGKVDFTYHGVASNAYGCWYIKGGKVQFGYSGTYTSGNSTYTIKSGKVVVKATVTSNTSNYLINEDSSKKYVGLIALGKITNLQSFCIYDGYYYSINEYGDIAKQDSNFNVISTATIDVGHGNALQLGHKGKAYASGWDDNTIYVVDLATMSVESTITLPTSGYTTCAVDDIRNIAYIFQRDTSPSTEEQYTFIAYDITNATELYTTRTSVAFSAIQAVDFYNDEIIVLNGMGTKESPNGYRVYDTNGNIVREYVFGDITEEPEGVFIDRDTNELYISTVSKKVYKVE